jgi:hypothetical protein
MVPAHTGRTMVGMATPPADRPLHPQNSGNGCLALVAHLVVDLATLGSIGPRPGR